MRGEKQIETSSMALVYGGLVLVSFVWDWISHGNPVWAWSSSSLPSFLYFVLAAVFVVFYVVVSIFCSRIFIWGQALESVFRQLLTPISYFQIVILALLSGFAEEWFFRGVLQNHFGLGISAIVFGLAHLLPLPKLWVWSVWAFFVGIVLGLFYRASGSLLLVSLMHAAINGILIFILNLSVYRTESPSLSPND